MPVTVLTMMQMQEFRGELHDAWVRSMSHTAEMKTLFHQNIKHMNEHIDFFIDHSLRLEAMLTETDVKLDTIRIELDEAAGTKTKKKKSKKTKKTKMNKENKVNDRVSGSTYRRWKRAAAFEGVDM